MHKSSNTDFTDDRHLILLDRLTAFILQLVPLTCTYSLEYFYISKYVLVCLIAILIENFGKMGFLWVESV